MTYNQIITLFENIAEAHKQLFYFGHGEQWEVDGAIKPGIKYPALWVMPVDSQTRDSVKIRTFTLLVFAQVKKDKSNETEIISDTEQIIDDVLKIIRNESDDYNLVNEPQMFPFKEEFGDWCAGWRCDIQFETDFNLNQNCDVPAEGFSSGLGTQKVFIRDQDGNLIASLNPGSTYYVTVLQAIQDTIDSNDSTIIENLD